MSVDKALDRDKELRAHATPRPWHQDGHGTMLRIVGPLPRASVVVDPYGPNRQDAQFLLHRVNTYEELVDEIERLRDALRAVQSELEAGRKRSFPDGTAEHFEALAQDLHARIGAALGDRRVDYRGRTARRTEANLDPARIERTRT